MNDKASDNLQEAATDVLCYAIFSVGVCIDISTMVMLTAILKSFNPLEQYHLALDRVK